MTTAPLVLVSAGAGGVAAGDEAPDEDGAGGAGGDVSATVAGVLDGLPPGTEPVSVGGAEDLSAALDRRGDRPLLVVGGDGSLHHAVQALHRRGELAAVDLGLVPLGTGNDLARALGLPLEPVAAAAAWATAPPRRLDLLVDDAGGTVVNAVHLGVGARAAGTAGRLKPLLGVVAYPLGAVAAGLGAGGWRLRVEVDPGRGRPPVVLADGRRRLLMVGVGNGPGIGGGTPLFPDAEPDDGRLDVVVTTAVGPLARLRYGVALRAGRHPERADTTSVRGVAVTVVGEAETNADGELGALSGRRTWRVSPGAWRLRVPD